MKKDKELLKAAETIAIHCCLTSDDISCYDCFFLGEDKNKELCCILASFAPFEWDEQLKVLEERSKNMIDKAGNDVVHHPNHYKWRSCGESVDVIKKFTDNQKDGFLAFCEGNILKYLYRYPKKNGVEDLKKLVEYANIAANYLEKVKEGR
jgi:hypothetical protein